VKRREEKWGSVEEESEGNGDKGRAERGETREERGQRKEERGESAILKVKSREEPMAGMKPRRVRRRRSEALRMWDQRNGGGESVPERGKV
jgi:hypothetical protein